MKKLCVILFFFIFNCLSIAGTSKQANAEIKRKLLIELGALQADLTSADAVVKELQSDKVHMRYNLQAMENWGIAQQEEKDKYYAEALDAESRIAVVQRQVDLEKVRQVELIAKYKKARQVLSYICGAFFLCLYLNFGAPILRAMSGLLGGYALLASFAAPALSFALGYTLIYFLF
jgi:hypothetical protein